MNKPLFKYLRRQHADALLSRGTVRVGTLHEFRRVEQHGRVIGDPDEGQHYTEFSIPGGGEIKLSDDTPEAAYFREQIFGQKDLKSDATMVLQPNTRFIRGAQSENFYVYCLTSELDPKLMRDFGYDAVIAMRQPDAFLNAISRRIRHRGTPLHFGPVAYKSKTADWKAPHDTHPAMLKSPEFANQYEWRALWRPTGSNPRPIVVNVPEAIRFCERYAA